MGGPARYAEIAREQRPGLSRLLLSATSEFRPVDTARTRVTLDRMAGLLCSWTVRDRMSPARALLRLLDEQGFRPARRVAPEDAMIDSVLLRGEGHPAAITAICVEAGLRAGLEIGAVSGAETIMVGLRPTGSTRDEETELIDPAGVVEQLDSPLRWRCSHEIAFIVLSELSRLYCMAGDINNAMRAAQMRVELPIGAELKRRLAFEVNALRALMN